ncbi:hypothetical protein ACFXMT_33035, partial [Streptomyces mirabilis]
QHEVKDHTLATYERQRAETAALLGDRLDLYQELRRRPLNTVTPAQARGRRRLPRRGHRPRPRPRPTGGSTAAVPGGPGPLRRPRRSLDPFVERHPGR